MRTIVKGNSIVSSVIGEQRTKDTEYRLMKYVFETEVEDGLLLHNVITGQLVLLTDIERSILSQLPQKPDEKINELIANYYLVPVDFDEYMFVVGYRGILQQVERNNVRPVTKYTIFPTTCCNAHCFYCFESEYQKINMTQEMAKKVADLIRRNVGDKQAVLGWFGGEPTVAMNRIDYICHLLREYGVDYISGMVSNGYLFTEDVVNKAVNDWKLQNIQITLDGTEEVYNKTKSYNVPGSPYQRVVNNIETLLKAGVRVTVLLNLDYHNSDDLYDLIDQLSKRFKQYGNFRMASHVLFNDEGYEKVHHTREQEEELAELNYRLADYMSNAGINGNVMGDVRVKGKLPKLRYMYCMANDSAAVVIGPNGNFYKCEHIEKALTSSAGIDTGPLNETELEEWFISEENKSCAECCLYPDCFFPRRCTDHAKCYPIDAERKLAGYKEIAQTLFHNISQNEQAEIKD